MVQKSAVTLNADKSLFTGINEARRIVNEDFITKDDMSTQEKLAKALRACTTAVCAHDAHFDVEVCAAVSLPKNKKAINIWHAHVSKMTAPTEARLGDCLM